MSDEPKLEAHVIDLDVKHVSMTYAAHPSIMSHSEYAWTCSCGKRGPGHLQREARSARNGGARHVAAMERGL